MSESDFDKWLDKRATALKRSNGMHCYYLRQDMQEKFDALIKRTGQDFRAIKAELRWREYQRARRLGRTREHIADFCKTFPAWIRGAPY